KMRRYVFTLLILLQNYFSIAQFRNSNWCFGDISGISFASGNPIVFSSGMDGRGSCSTISDSLGNLLFYASTPDKDLYLSGYLRLADVYNSNHVKMQGGDSLIGDGWYQELIIIPVQLHSNLFYLFQAGVTLQNDYG